MANVKRVSVMDRRAVLGWTKTSMGTVAEEFELVVVLSSKDVVSFSTGPMWGKYENDRPVFAKQSSKFQQRGWVWKIFYKQKQKNCYKGNRTADEKHSIQANKINFISNIGYIFLLWVDSISNKISNARQMCWMSKSFQ